MWKGVTDSKKAICLSKEETKKQSLDSMVIDGIVEFDDLNKEAEETQDLAKAAETIKQYKDIIKTKKNGIINIACYQGEIFKRLRKRKSLLSLSMN